MTLQREAQVSAVQTPPRKGFPYRVAHVDGRITNHREFRLAEKSWTFGDVIYQWYRSRWAIWTSAGLF